jgi:hypothetical protein
VEAVIDCSIVRMAEWCEKGRLCYRRGHGALWENTGLILSNPEVQLDDLLVFE